MITDRELQNWPEVVVGSDDVLHGGSGGEDCPASVGTTPSPVEPAPGHHGLLGGPTLHRSGTEAALTHDR
jgi:hypothetical protein